MVQGLKIHDINTQVLCQMHHSFRWTIMLYLNKVIVRDSSGSVTLKIPSPSVIPGLKYVDVNLQPNGIIMVVICV